MESEQKRRDSILDDFNVLPAIQNTCGLSRLPDELLDIIFQYLPIDYIFVLGLQSQNLWEVAWRHIQAYFAPSCGPWAGKNIICVGNYSEPTDYPNILTESEKKELQKEMSEIDDLEEDERNLYHLANARYQKVSLWPPSLITYAGELGEWLSLSPYRQSRLFHELNRFEMSNFYPEDQPWILRNLTTQEYVRSEAIAIKPEYIRGPNIEGLGFGEVVWSRICWSTDANCAMECTDNIHRGVWAGHRFDIITLDGHKQGSLEGTEWKDVSEEVANDLERIWSKEFGSNWRDIIQEGVLTSHNRPLPRFTYLEEVDWSQEGDWSQGGSWSRKATALGFGSKLQRIMK